MQVRRKRKRRDQLTEFAEFQRQGITKRIGSKKSPVAEYKDVIYKMVKHIVRQSNYRCKEHGQEKEAKGEKERERNGTSVLYEHKRNFASRVGFYYLRCVAQILAFSTIYCKQQRFATYEPYSLKRLCCLPLIYRYAFTAFR